MAAQFELTAVPARIPAGLPPAQWCECPAWDDTFQCIWWVDVLNSSINVARTCAKDGLAFDRVAVLPLKDHRPGFVVHSTADYNVYADKKASPLCYAELGSGSGCTATEAANTATTDTVESMSTCMAASAGSDSQQLQHHRQPTVAFYRKTDKNIDSRYVAVWGSQKGLFVTVLPSGMPWIPEVFSSSHDTTSQRKFQSRMQAAKHYPLATYDNEKTPLEEESDLLYTYHSAVVSPDGCVVAGAVDKTSKGRLLIFNHFTSASASASTPMPQPKTSVLLDGIAYTNGMGWSPDGRTFYLVDNIKQAIIAYPHHMDRHTLDASHSYVYWTLPQYSQAEGATLQGLCVDAAGNVWVAVSGVSQILRLSRQRGATTEAAVTGTVRVPGITHVTNCCFGGPDRSVLYITTARGKTTSEVEACKEAHAGFLHVVNLSGIANGMLVSRVSLDGFIKKLSPSSKL